MEETLEDLPPNTTEEIHSSMESVNSTDSERIDGETADTEANSEGLTAELRSLYDMDKVELLTDLVRERLEIAKGQHKLDVLRHALEELAGTKATLQLELACSNGLILGVQERTQKRANLFRTVGEQYNSAIKKVAEHDAQRVARFKSHCALQKEFKNFEEEISRVENEVWEQNERRRVEKQQMDDEIAALITTNDALEKEITEIKEKYEAHQQQKQREKQLTVELTDTKKGLASSKRENAELQEIIDMMLEEDIKLATEYEMLEQEQREIEAYEESCIAEREQEWQSVYKKEMEAADAERKANEKEILLEREKMEETIACRQNEIENLEEMIETNRIALEQSEAELAQKIEAFEKANAEIREQQDKLDEEKRLLEIEEQEIEAEIAKYEEECKELQDLQTKEEHLQKEINDFEAQFRLHDVQLKKNTTQLSALQAEWSIHLGHIKELEDSDVTSAERVEMWLEANQTISDYFEENDCDSEEEQSDGNQNEQSSSEKDNSNDDNSDYVDDDIDSDTVVEFDNDNEVDIYNHNESNIDNDNEVDVNNDNEVDVENENDMDVENENQVDDDHNHSKINHNRVSVDDDEEGNCPEGTGTCTTTSRHTFKTSSADYTMKLGDHTSTPIRMLQYSSSLERTPPKKTERSSTEGEESSNPTSSSYNAFQKEINRRSAPRRFFTRASPTRPPSRPAFLASSPSSTSSRKSILSNVSSVEIIDCGSDDLSSRSSVQIVKPFFRKHPSK